MQTCKAEKCQNFQWTSQEARTIEGWYGVAEAPEVVPADSCMAKQGDAKTSNKPNQQANTTSQSIRPQNKRQMEENQYRRWSWWLQHHRTSVNRTKYGLYSHSEYVQRKGSKSHFGLKPRHKHSFDLLTSLVHSLANSSTCCLSRGEDIAGWCGVAEEGRNPSAGSWTGPVFLNGDLFLDRTTHDHRHLIALH